MMKKQSRIRAGSDKAGLEIAYKLKHAFYRDECKFFIVYAPLGYGKSTYAVKGLAECFENEHGPNYEKVKQFLVFHPKDFVSLCNKMMVAEKREIAMLWDDAGFWLYALDWNHPFVRAVGRYMNVARTNWGGVIFTTPLPTWVIKKVRGLPDCYTTKIIKTHSDKRYPSRPRRAIGYLQWMAADMKKTGVRKVFEDDFKATMPNDFYQWYKPIRDTFAKQGINLMQNKLAELGDQLLVHV